MSRKRFYSFSVLAVVIFLTWVFSSPNERTEEFPEQVKIALRDVGNQLLLSNQDSTSLILPVIELETSKYQLSFQNELSFKPSNLVSAIEESFHASALPNYYRVEILQCSDQQVAYSYEMKGARENSIIPCFDRVLPASCYTLRIRFTGNAPSFFNQKGLPFASAIAVLLLFAYLFYKNKPDVEVSEISQEHLTLSSFQFYPEQHKLIRDGVEISLSRKESELLKIFCDRPNQIITRDELTKRVWEDHGVFVGRSLDTFISKLRKILKEDPSIQLTNTYGVGYKLEVGRNVLNR